ncbi:PHB depolymerase family esterase [Janthinobacterium sp. 17J80-10]|uniref:alpha/beta hydrolase n=1 Tax=Janthinobacterium sp. 17J80-10 TaxID=2497863 RepID=UPI0010054946|nr:PHB depolymerase family esterase [Janthinobacterium sp. 17J80-10]QAU35468.1 phospholipase [Janthinobacterium sp. 17J80-10]
MQHSLNDLVTHPALPLAHRLRSPAAATDDAGGGIACLILLHGVGANEANLIDLAQRQDPRLLVILARGPLAFGPAQFGWFNVNFTSGGPVINAPQAEASRAALVQFIEGLPAAYGVDPQRIWIAGFSQGGILSASVALSRPDRVAGFGILSGRILPEIAPITAPNELTQNLAGFVSHGIEDNKLTVEFARSAQRLLQQKAVQLTYREYNAVHELNAAMQGDFCHWLSQQLDATQG